MPTTKKLISMDASIAQELEAVASALHVTQKEIIERALDFYFDHTDGIIAEKLSRDVEEGREIVHDAKTVFDRLGLTTDV